MCTCKGLYMEEKIKYKKTESNYEENFSYATNVLAGYCGQGTSMG